MTEVAEGSLIKSFDRGEVYVVEAGRRRWIPDPATFESRWSWDQIREMSQQDIDGVPIGDQIPSVVSSDIPGTEAVREVIERYRQWVIGANQPPEPVMPRAAWTEDDRRGKYDLKNLKTNLFLQHEEQSLGINVGYSDDASEPTALRVRRWFFTRKDGNPSPITYGESVALGNGRKPSFLKYGERSVGVNLHYSDQPVYEWIIGGGVPGTVVNTGDRVALFNEHPDELNFLIYFDRTVGANIGWPDSKTWGDQLLGTLGSIAKDAIVKAVKGRL